MLVSRETVGTIAVMAGVPAVLTPFCRSLAELVKFSHLYLCGPDQEIALDWSNHSFHSVARNQMAARALGEWVWFTDTDHQFSCDTLARMVNTMRQTDAPVVSGVYLLKQPPHHPAAWKYFPDGTHTQYVEWPKDEKVEVDTVGAGCLLVKTALLRKMYDEFGEEPFSTQEFRGTVGEDFAFCRRAAKLGFKVVLDTAIQSHHIQLKPLVYGVDNDVNAGATRESVTKKVVR